MASQSVQAANHNCTDCHGTQSPGATDLVKPLSMLCADCHQARIAAGEHRVDVPVTTAGNNALPLSDGKMTCITCHDPHGTSLALRMKDPDLCNHCHKR
ncbi:cytochrome c3 family protein [Kaarinaea lacus]